MIKTLKDMVDKPVMKPDNKAISKKLIYSTKDGLSIFSVDADIVRDMYDIDFTMGGNSAIYEFIPENEIWIESMQNKEDFITTIMHEVYEYYLIKNAKIKYSAAHDHAKQLERVIRNIWNVPENKQVGEEK